MGREFEWVKGAHWDSYVEPKGMRGRVAQGERVAYAWVWPRGSLVGDLAPFYEMFATTQQARDWVEAKVTAIDKPATQEDTHGL